MITFSDVMAGVISLALGILSFFIRSWFKSIQTGNEEIKAKIDENDRKINERVEKLEAQTGADIKNLKEELNDIKGDFATTFVLREDFFRAMNGVEDKVKSIDSKLDRLLMQK